MKRLASFAALGLGSLLLLILAVNAAVYGEARPYLYNDAAAAPHAGVILIPGAPVLPSGAPAPVFIDRVNTAIELYTRGKAPKILVSGDNGTAGHNEVDPVRDYLLQNGIPDKDIFLDHAGFDTYSTMYRAREIFGVSSVLIASQSFHLPRAIFIARRLGMEAYGVNTDVGHILFSNYVREVFANEKAAFDLLTHRRPMYEGEKIPILPDEE
ncbi:TPA: hypothetical protein DIV48_02905 [Candidatus Kaiserbacteria bacterium]|nr:MAG: hypothetical protein UY93_C0002G0321 [Parcubacteria group bacterium GW2011_GWA1_56_13]HCR52571.1 hypothetical protein [Candidatus Kaiserbacteria bacterium]